jgi:hypothetical protein
VAGFDGQAIYPRENRFGANRTGFKAGGGQTMKAFVLFALAIILAACSNNPITPRHELKNAISIKVVYWIPNRMAETMCAALVDSAWVELGRINVNDSASFLVSDSARITVKYRGSMYPSGIYTVVDTVARPNMRLLITQESDFVK